MAPVINVVKLAICKKNKSILCSLAPEIAEQGKVKAHLVIEVEENNQKKRREREAIQVIVLKVLLSQGRRRKIIEERNHHQAQDQDLGVPHEIQIENLY
jgi:hypothetical protein